jgi:long-chain acyl-CoA synthetase
MNIFLKNNATPALTFADGQMISFAELRAQVDARKRHIVISPLIQILPAQTRLEFIVETLAYLEVGQPLAILNPALTAAERRTFEHLLTASFHPELALVLLTSGSDGRPKAVQLSRTNIQANTQAVLQSLFFSEATEQTLALPLHYSFGLLGQLIPALHIGLTTHLLNHFNEAIFRARLAPPQGMWSGVPAQWELWLKTLDPKVSTLGMTHIISAGAPLSPDLRHRLVDRCPGVIVANNYGLTECSPRVLSMTSREPAFFEAVVGRPVAGLEVQTTSEGELMVRGPQVMLGYLGDESNSRLRDGWLYTGDRATILPNGYVQIDGRFDDMIKVAGERISCLEIQQALQSLPDVSDAFVGLIHDDLGQARLTAWIQTPRPHAVPHDHLIEQLSRKLSATKIPKVIYKLENFPRLANGKLDRQRILSTRN